MSSMKFYTTEIESWWYPKEDGAKGYSYQCVVHDDLTSEVVAKGPVRDIHADALMDEQELRAGQQKVKDWQGGRNE